MQNNNGERREEKKAKEKISDFASQSEYFVILFFVSKISDTDCIGRDNEEFLQIDSFLSRIFFKFLKIKNM